MDILSNTKRNRIIKKNRQPLRLNLNQKLVKQSVSLSKFSDERLSDYSFSQDKNFRHLRKAEKPCCFFDFKREDYLKQKYQSKNFFAYRKFYLPTDSNLSDKEHDFDLKESFQKGEKITLEDFKRVKNRKLFKVPNFFTKIPLWKVSLTTGVFCGMLLMTFWHYSFSEVVLAQIEHKENLEKNLNSLKNKKEDALYFSNEENFFSRENISDEKKKDLEKRIREMVVGYPIENMIPYILEQDYQVAMYMIAIAKQESQWGERVPVLNGKDCYNYWGYRENRELMGSAGHTCFNSREDAVETVGKRLDDLLYKYNRQTADKLIIWKCGFSCEGHNPEGVDAWIGTVGRYYSELAKK